jgi:hypothetical protein
VQQKLQKLHRLGLVAAHKDGNRVAYTANKSHPLYPEIHRIVLKTGGLADLLRNALTHPKIEWAFVFGSIARGEDAAESDVDLLVIGDIGLRAVANLLSGVAEQIGREINPHRTLRAGSRPTGVSASPTTRPSSSAPSCCTPRGIAPRGRFSITGRSSACRSSSGRNEEWTRSTWRLADQAKPVEYDYVGGASDDDVSELLDFAKELRGQVLKWLKASHPAVLRPSA